MTETPQQLRDAAMKFALEAYQKVKHNRAYALDEQNKIALAALARAMFERRIAEGRSHMDAQPSSWQEFFEIIGKLAASGANVLQRRPGDPPPLPKQWRDPVSLETLPNPWKTKDLKAQSLLQVRDPELAAHYKAMAADPYGTIAKMQDELAARATLEQVPYSDSEHSVNVFRGNDQTAKALFIKNASPGLVAFYQNEAKPVEIPLFGKGRNLTIEGALARDPATFALMKTAQQIRDTWTREDTRAAQDRKDAAEQEIKRLQTIAA